VLEAVVTSSLQFFDFFCLGLFNIIDLSVLPNRTLIGRICRYPLRIIPKRMAVPILQGPLKGRKWIVGSQRHAFWLGSYEPHMQHLIAQEVKSGQVFYDVGANVGFYSLLASVLVGPGKVFAFEPLPANIAYLRQHLVLNAAENVEVLEVAVCDQVGASSFQTERTGAMGRLETCGDIRVPTTTLDALLQEGKIAPPTYIKMDIEGTEFRALSGAKTCFEKYKPTLFLATHDGELHRRCCDLLRAWEFDIKPIAKTSEGRAEILARPAERS
jgi:FkbM family methyltransferase